MLVKGDVLPSILLLLESPNADYKNMRQLCEQTLDIVQQFSSEENECQKSQTKNYNINEFKTLYKSTDFEFLMNCNKVFVIGSDFNGKLGLGQIKECHTYTEIPELSDKLIEEVFEGNDCMFARSETNVIYSWGNNYWGQLAKGFESGMLEYFKPEKIEFFDNKKIIEIAIHLDYCLALSSDGNVYGWGDNHHGQLVHNLNINQILTPILRNPPQIDPKDKWQSFLKLKYIDKNVLKIEFNRSRNYYNRLRIPRAIMRKSNNPFLPLFNLLT